MSGKSLAWPSKVVRFAKWLDRFFQRNELSRTLRRYSSRQSSEIAFADAACPLPGAKRKTYAHIELFRF